MLDTARRRTDRQIVLHDTDTGGIGIMDVDEFTHAVSVVHGGAAACYLDVAPAAMRIEVNEEIDGAVAAVLIIVALALSGPGRYRLTHLGAQVSEIRELRSDVITFMSCRSSRICANRRAGQTRRVFPDVAMY